jgi:hypothetical protein
LAIRGNPRVDVVSYNGVVTCQTDCGEMAMRWLRTEWLEGQAR